MQYTRSESGSSITYNLKDRFIFSDHAVFDEIITDIQNSMREQFVLDMSGLDFLDSAALGMLVILKDTVTNSRKNVRINGARGKVADVLKASNLDTFFNG